MSDKSSFIPEDDVEFENDLAQKAKLAREQDLKRRQEQAEAENAERKSYERKLQEQKVELLRLKQGVIDHSDEIKEIKEKKKKLSFGEWLENVWYRSKWLILFCVFLCVAFGYIVYHSVTTVQPDYTVLVVTDNYSLYYRTEELKSFMQTYCDDINGDGEVNVLIYNILSDMSDPTMSTSYQAQIMAQLQTGDNMLIISDGTTDFEVHDFTQEISSDVLTDKGIKLNCELTRDKLKWQEMPDELYLGIREPHKLLSTSLETMQHNFDDALPVFMRILEDVSQDAAQNPEVDTTGSDAENELN